MYYRILFDLICQVELLMLIKQETKNKFVFGITL